MSSFTASLCPCSNTCSNDLVPMCGLIGGARIKATAQEDHFLLTLTTPQSGSQGTVNWWVGGFGGGVEPEVFVEGKLKTKKQACKPNRQTTNPWESVLLARARGHADLGHPLEFLQTFFEREAAGELDDDLEVTWEPWEPWKPSPFLKSAGGWTKWLGQKVGPQHVRKRLGQLKGERQSKVPLPPASDGL